MVKINFCGVNSCDSSDVNRSVIHSVDSRTISACAAAALCGRPLQRYIADHIDCDKIAAWTFALCGLTLHAYECDAVGTCYDIRSAT